jgi:ABC-type amino acid transport substrate-binding protein
MFNINYKIIALGLSFLAVCAAWLLIQHQPNQKHTDQLIIGTCSGFPPYEMLDNQGNLIGFDIDVAHALAAHMHKQVIFKDMSFDALVLAIKQGTIDIALAGISITKAKLKEVALIHYQGAPITYIPLLFWQHIPDGIATIDDLQKLSNNTVCVQAGNFEEDILSHYQCIILKQLSNISDLIMDIKYGKSIAACVDPEVAQALVQQTPALKILHVPLSPNDQPLGQGICIAKHNTPLITHVQTVIDQLKHDGTLAALENKWFKKGDAHVAD